MVRQAAAVLGLVIPVILLTSCQSESNTLSRVTVLPQQAIIFQDEFDGSALDRKKWTTELGWGRSNPPELQYYAEDMLLVRNGELSMQAEARRIKHMDYASGMISSINSFTFTYGYIEARIKMPAGQGLWSALWLLDAAGSADEIDIVELLGNAPHIAYMTLHYADQNGHQQGTADGRYEGPNFSDAFHTFGLDWQPASITWIVDGVERYRVTENIPGKPMYLIANLAVGGDWPGAPDKSTHFPAVYQMDYIRVYQPSSSQPTIFHDREQP